MTASLQLGQRRESGTGGWSRPVTVDGVAYIVGVVRGKRVRIAYKPRGPGGWGFWWHGYVRDAKGKEIWSGRVGKSAGARGILEDAGILMRKAKRVGRICASLAVPIVLGARVRLRRVIERSAEIQIPAGETGTVTDVAVDGNALAVQLDRPFACLEHWDNELLWGDGDILWVDRDLEVLIPDEEAKEPMNREATNEETAVAWVLYDQATRDGVVRPEHIDNAIAHNLMRRVGDGWVWTRHGAILAERLSRRVPQAAAEATADALVGPPVDSPATIAYAPKDEP